MVRDPRGAPSIASCSGKRALPEVVAASDRPPLAGATVGWPASTAAAMARLRRSSSIRARYCCKTAEARSFGCRIATQSSALVRRKNSKSALPSCRGSSLSISLGDPEHGQPVGIVERHGIAQDRQMPGTQRAGVPLHPMKVRTHPVPRQLGLNQESS